MYSNSRKLSLAGVLVLLGTLALMVAGCGSSPASTIRPPSQQIFRFPLDAASTDVKTMDPASTQDFYSGVPVGLVYPGLLTLAINNQPVPWAAAGMPVFDAAKNTYTFTVRSGLKWSDGTPIDANTFAYSINRSLSPCTASPVTYYMFPIMDAQAFSTETCGSDGTTIKGKIQSLIGDSLNVPDSQTLVITLNAPAPYFLQAMTYPTAFAQPEQLIQQYGTKDWTAHLTDNGGFGGSLYKVSLWDHKGDLDLVANPSFWGTQPKLRQIDFKIYQTISADYSHLPGRWSGSGNRSTRSVQIRQGPLRLPRAPLSGHQLLPARLGEASFQQRGCPPGLRSGARQDGAGQPGQRGNGDRHQPYRAPGHVWL